MNAIEVGCCPDCGRMITTVDEVTDDLVPKFRCEECGTLYNSWVEAEECCPDEEETQLKDK